MCRCCEERVVLFLIIDIFVLLFALLLFQVLVISLNEVVLNPVLDSVEYAGNDDHHEDELHLGLVGETQNTNNPQASLKQLHGHQQDDAKQDNLGAGDADDHNE